jgi:hypothetical protein
MIPHQIIEVGNTISQKENFTVTVKYKNNIANHASLSNRDIRQIYKQCLNESQSQGSQGKVQSTLELDCLSVLT